MILEGVVTTLGLDGMLHIAAMGPEIGDSWAEFTLRPFRTAMTLRNLRATRAGVLHITDDVDLIARVVVRETEEIETRPAATVAGRVLQTTGRYHEFQVVAIDDSTERVAVRVKTVASGRQVVDLFGLNRAKFAVVEAAILATRLSFLPPEQVRADLDRWAVVVGKTGGPEEIRAFERIDRFVRDATMGC